MTKVSVASVKNQTFSSSVIDDVVERAIDCLSYDFSGVKNVMIKPNLCYYWNASTGETTDGRVVCSVIKYLKKKIGNDVNITVAEADASAMRTKYAFSILGYNDVCQQNSVELKNLSEGSIVDRTVEVGKASLTLPFNEELLNADLVVNVPKLKTHNFVGVTCAMKNMFGAISKPRKYVYHRNIENVIVAANKIVPSDIVVVDGLIVRGSCPKKLGVIIAGDNALSTDFVAAKAMSFNPKKMLYLHLAAKEKIGATENIHLIEDNITLAEVKKNFPHYSYRMHALSWDLQLRLLRAYTAVSGDVLPPFLEQ
ncbi:MAG: DUF362 domain-containing protein [Candidatus Bathyarchaeota archaeon]|jgi:uncharacterized protein (DUF362 family)|nr:DUF362 domain-containing protein [Candidatus Bathyarchaeota archaeon]